MTRLSIAAALLAGAAAGPLLAGGAPQERLAHETWQPGAQDVAVLPGRVPLLQTNLAQRKADGYYEIDLMVVFTPRYADRYGGDTGAQAEVQRLVELANASFTRTGLRIRYELVAAERYTGISETVPFYPSLDLLRQDPAVAAYRDGVGADLVALLRTNDYSADLCGLSAGFNGMVHSEFADHVDANADAFMVAGMGPSAEGQRCMDYVFTHELGHNLGGGHNFAAYPLPQGYWKPYAHGWDCGLDTGGNRYASIMSYGSTGAEARGDFFSSSSLVLNGEPCGSSGVPGVEPSQADNARVLLEAAPYVAAYRRDRD